MSVEDGELRAQAPASQNDHSAVKHLPRALPHLPRIVHTPNLKNEVLTLFGGAA